MMIIIIMVYFKSASWITSRIEAPASIYADPTTTSSHFSFLGTPPKLQKKKKKRKKRDHTGPNCTPFQ